MFTRTRVRLSIGPLLLLGATTIAAEDDGRSEVAPICRVGTTKQLFIDDHVIDEIVGLKRVMNQPERHPDNPLVVPEHPWEGSVLEMPTVVWDDRQKLFHMYYWALHSEAIYTCYARSKDGIAWEKPMLGLHKGPDGTTDNNIVLRGEGTQARTRYVAINPYSAGPGKRFVTMYIDNVPGLTEFVGYSPDGIHWTTVAKLGDLRNVTGGPPTPNPRFFLIEQRWASDPDHRYRGIWRTESHDLKTWGGGTWIVQRLPDDDPNLEFYHAASHFLGTHTYHGLHLGYLYPFHTEADGEKLANGTRMAGTIDTSLMVSRDTIHWQRVDRTKPFLPNGSQGSWDAGMLFGMPEIVVGDQLRFYYCGIRFEHAAKNNEGALGLATLRLDGFVSLEAGNDPGTLVTRPFELAGGTLELNVEAPEGEVLVEILDQKGASIAGFAGEQADVLRGVDSLRLRPTWKSNKLESLKGKTVRLKITLTRGKLYALQVKP
jgi:hypothetical protein